MHIPNFEEEKELNRIYRFKGEVRGQDTKKKKKQKSIDEENKEEGQEVHDFKLGMFND
jgi:hypothetical protein